MGYKNLSSLFFFQKKEKQKLVSWKS